jgi:phosphatidylglycerol lysyltransferase
MPSRFSFAERFEYLRQFGSHCLAYSTLQPGMEYFDRPGVGYLAYQTCGKTRYFLGEPVCAVENRPAFIQAALADHRASCFVQMKRPTAELLCSQFGFHATQLGIETQLDLSTWTARGRKKVMLRNNRNQALKQNVTVAERSANEATRREVDALSARWMSTRKVKQRQMAFLARPLTMDHEPGARGFFAARDQQMVGFILFDPLYSGGSTVGYHPDIARSDVSLKIGLYYALLLTAIEQFRGEGVRWMNLGLSPLSQRTLAPLRSSPLTNALLSGLYRFGNGIYNFKGIEFTKSRFGGEELPVYCCHQSQLPLREIFSVFHLCHVI